MAKKRRRKSRKHRAKAHRSHRKHRRSRRVKAATEYMANPRRRRRHRKASHKKHRRVRRHRNPSVKQFVTESKSTLFSFESLGLLVGGAVNPMISGFVEKVLPASIVNPMVTVPGGTSVIPAILGLLLDSYGKGRWKKLGAGVVGAAIVQTGYDLGQIAAGVSGGMIPGFAGYVSAKTGRMGALVSGQGLNFGQPVSRTGVDFGAIKSYASADQANFGKPTLVLSGPSILRGRLAGGSEADSDVLGPSYVADGDMVSGADAQLG